MFKTQTLITYLTASIVIILAPGPAQALVLTRSISDGMRIGIITALGLNVGTIFHAIAAALGLSAILATSALAFATVKYLGAVYLLYLGVMSLISYEHQLTLIGASNGGPSDAFKTAIVTGILNPKVALFFLAFLPQFVDPNRSFPSLQFFVLGLFLALLDTLYESILAFTADALGRWLANKPKFVVWRQRVTGVVLMALGLRLAFAERS